MSEELLGGGMIGLIGLFSLVCAAADFDWFMENRRARLFVAMMGRQGARVFYAILGAAFIGLGVAFATGIVPLHS